MLKSPSAGLLVAVDGLLRFALPVAAVAVMHLGRSPCVSLLGFAGVLGRFFLRCAPERTELSPSPSLILYRPPLLCTHVTSYMFSTMHPPRHEVLLLLWVIMGIYN